ncbi:MAG: methyltransferase domain-containing protein, partial [bacterium]|nr:methyltransferase domain-containing protein [bacterium]
MADIFEQKWKERFSQAAKGEEQNKDQSLLIEGNPYYREYFLEYAGAILGKGVPGMKVLDVGCGTGSTCRVLAERGFEVYGVDFSPEIIEAAKKKAAKNNVSLNLQVADIYQLPFPDNMFDIVVCNYL